MSYKYLKDWELNPKTLKPQEALWVKYQDEANISLQKYKNQDSYDFNESAIKTCWNFVGLGTSLSTKTLTNKTIWGFDGKNWLENPNKIPRGYGVWIKRD